MLVAVSDTPVTTRTVKASPRCHCSRPRLVVVPHGTSEQPYCLTDGPVSPYIQQVFSIMPPLVCPTMSNAVAPNSGCSTDTSLSSRMHFPKTMKYSEIYWKDSAGS